MLPMLLGLCAVSCQAANRFAAAAPKAGSAKPAPARPNIILVMPDDQGYGDLGSTGNPVLKTPHLDAFAKQSVRFTDFHVSPTCAPTRAALLTGRHEFKNGVTHTINERERLTHQATTLAQVLKKSGYTTGIFGKWHLGDEAEYQPGRRGFDEVFIHGAGGIGQTYAGSCGDAPDNSYFDPAILHNGRFEKTKGYCTDVFFNQAVKWMDEKRQARAPFLTLITPNAPHGPLHVPDEYFNRYKGKVPDNVAKFFGMIENIDDNFGAMIKKLDEWGLTENTLVIFMTDNGGTAGVRIFNAGMRAGKATVDLAGLILRDSAKVQGYEAQRTTRKRQRAGQAAVEPLYDASEVERTLEHFRVVNLDQPFAVADGITARYVGAGHMLGSASIELTVLEKGKTKVIVFSGDIGPSGLAIVRDAETLKRADVVFLESTYGDRDHKPLKETLAEFRAIIERAVTRKARILVPAFAVGRTQQIIYHLDEMFCAGTLKPFPIYIDSPMDIEATKIYQRHPDLFDAETIDMQRACKIASRHGHVKPTPTAEDSMKLNDAPGPCLIMAGSGMCTAGRILHHLRHGLWQPETSVVIVGYQGEGSLGRQLVDGAKEVKIFGETIAVKAQIHTLNGFSAHAGQTELLKWFKPLGILSGQRQRIVHSEVLHLPRVIQSVASVSAR